MADETRTDFLLARAQRALGKRQVSEAVATVRAIIGPSEIDDSEPLAQAALEKMHNGIVPTPQELAALEIVVRMLRPVVFTQDDALGDLPDGDGANLQPEELKDGWRDFRGKVNHVVGSIGRIENRRGEHIGTGFVVADGVVATNRHVLGVLTSGGEALAPGAARIVFGWEDGKQNKAQNILALDGVAAIHPKLDMVLLTIRKEGRPAVQFEPAPVAVAARVVAIGYPAQDTVNNPLFLASVFQGRFGRRCAALGEVLDGTESPDLFHDCSTTQGNSGSPLFNLATGLVAGIHRGGHFMYRNEAIDADQIRSFVQGTTT
jgi:S1-C subfamily serine protease